MRDVFNHLLYPPIWRQALNGRLSVQVLFLQGSIAAFWLFLSVKVLEARKWS